MEGIYELGDFTLQSGTMLPEAKLSYSAHGELDEQRGNVIVYPTWATGRHTHNEAFVGPDKALDPEQYFIVIPDMFTNGLSSSPSNTPAPYDGPRFPLVTPYDNVIAQHRLLTEVFGVTRIRLVLGFSMSGQQAFHWGALYPEMVERICCTCGSAKTSVYNGVYLAALQAVFEAAEGWNGGDCLSWPPGLLRALARIAATMAWSQDFFRLREFEKMGAAGAEEFMTAVEGFLADWAPIDFYAQLSTWRAADASAHPRFGGDLEKALGSITAKALVMPCDTDLYFRVADNEWEVERMPDAELRVIPSVWGHFAGGPGQNPEDEAFVDRAVKELLASEA